MTDDVKRVHRMPKTTGKGAPNKPPGGCMEHYDRAMVERLRELGFAAITETR